MSRIILETITKETFLDRRNSQFKTINSTPQIKCIHTKNIFSMLDMNQSEESYKKTKKHVDACITCMAELKKFELENIEIKIHIPKPQIDTETKGIFAREVSDLFRAFDLNEKELLRTKIKTKIKSIDSFGVSLIKNLASKKMITSYAFGAVLFVVLRQFFN